MMHTETKIVLECRLLLCIFFHLKDNSHLNQYFLTTVYFQKSDAEEPDLCVLHNSLLCHLSLIPPSNTFTEFCYFGEP